MDAATNIDPRRWVCVRAQLLRNFDDAASLLQTNNSNVSLTTRQKHMLDLCNQDLAQDLKQDLAHETTARSQDAEMDLDAMLKMSLSDIGDTDFAGVLD
jgi:hypothetical protein